MKKILSVFSLMILAGVLFSGCDKKDVLPVFQNGTAPVLSASTTTIAAQPADSNNVALTLSWSNPKYATDSSSTKYIIQIDSAGKNFANPLTRTVNGKTST